MWAFPVFISYQFSSVVFFQTQKPHQKRDHNLFFTVSEKFQFYSKKEACNFLNILYPWNVCVNICSSKILVCVFVYTREDCQLWPGSHSSCGGREIFLSSNFHKLFCSHLICCLFDLSHSVRLAVNIRKQKKWQLWSWEIGRFHKWEAMYILVWMFEKSRLKFSFQLLSLQSCSLRHKKKKHFVTR